MQLGMIGLGRMGANMVRRLMKDGHQCVVFDMSPAVVAGLAGIVVVVKMGFSRVLAVFSPSRRAALRASKQDRSAGVADG